ncbi:Rha family transcriptional regulator [Sphingomonas sp. NY01]|uniref:Rha family transcriptional regulator n=1 Tax=Sphingomonas sp. NY01 TaxID=2968057 RepID=UPI00315C5D97
MSELVKIEAGRVVADSREVALTFDKHHKDVLRAIDRLVKAEPELRRNFAPMLFEAPGGNGAIRRFRRCDIDRDGFALLAMGFTGPKALQWKMRYIEAFNRMEAALLAPVIAEAPAESLIAMPAFGFTDEQVRTIETVHKLADAVGKMSRVAGRAMAMDMWTKLGGSMFADSVPALPAPRVADAGVASWLSERVESAADGEMPTRWLHEDYQGWCATNGARCLVLSEFGRHLNRLGVPQKMSNGSQRVGVRLRPIGEVA